MSELSEPFVIIAFPNGDLDDWQPVTGIDSEGNSAGMAFYETIDSAWDAMDDLKLDHPESEFRVYRLELAEGEEELSQRVLH